MYVPSRFKDQGDEQVEEIIRQFPLATVISVDNGSPFVSHLPLLLQKNEKGLVLVGHLAVANPHAKKLASGPVTAIFHGPNTYITPSWYSINNVPTWSYVVVHVRGRVEMIHDEAGVVECVRHLSDTMEKTSKNPWEFWIPDDLQNGVLEKAIAGFRIHVENINAKFKLSQQHPELERKRVIDALKTDRADEASHSVAQWMAQTKSVHKTST
ncbi:MAG TPA: FMN-binding negative transcriptional regulator [Bdellovibrionales bacterium]|nr:FMN-binding negative transcriptional regulator [Bdellovibrionales bacterium]